VIDFLKKTKGLVSVQNIYDSLRHKLDKVTVYRVLNILEEVGVVFKEYNNKEAFYYLANKQHHHIICQKCGKSQCIPCNHIFNNIKNFSQVKHQLVLTGICNKCNK